FCHGDAGAASELQEAVPSLEGKQRKVLPFYAFGFWSANFGTFYDVASLLLSTLLIVGPAITFCCQIIIKIHEYEKSDKNSDRPMLWLSILMVAFLVTISPANVISDSKFFHLSVAS
ncbi:hypothetical protein B296_00018906, partial [Ensete ventricosum]